MEHGVQKYVGCVAETIRREIYFGNYRK